jgi:hypothetical protein
MTGNWRLRCHTVHAGLNLDSNVCPYLCPLRHDLDACACRQVPEHQRHHAVLNIALRVRATEGSEVAEAEPGGAPADNTHAHAGYAEYI